MSNADHGGDGGQANGAWRFRLYIAGSAPYSRQAIDNLARICEVHLAGCCKVEVIDVLEEPLRTLDDQVYVTPTLVRTWPEPVCRIIGNLSDEPQVLSALGIVEGRRG